MKTAYTKEMADSYEKPGVGVDVMWGGHNNNYVPCKILCIDGDQFFMLIDGEHRIIGNPTNFKPITPQVDLIDGEAYQFECDMLDDCLKGIYRKMNNSFYNYNGDFGVEHCTNIKLLETKS